MEENTTNCKTGPNAGENAALSILIVEDEVIVADDLRVTLQCLGYSVDGTERTGEGALETIRKKQPGLVLMDVHLAGKLDGVDAAGEIHRLYGIPVIYLTAYADSALLDRAKITEPYGYIIKPYQERELESVIEMARFKFSMDRKLRQSEDSLRKLNEELEERVAVRTASLREQLAFLQQLVDTIPAPVYYKDTRGMYLGCNNAFEAYTGIPRLEIIFQSDAALFPSDMAALSDEKDTQLISRRGIQVYQAKFPHADQTPRDVIFKKATFNDARGEIAGFIGVMIDITDRIHAEGALKECEERFSAVAGDMGELVYRSSLDRTCVFANAAFLRYFHRNAEDTIGYLFTPATHPDDVARMQKHLGSLSPQNPAGHITCRVTLPDGTVRSLSWNTRAFFDSNGHVREYQYVGQEVLPAQAPPGAE
jgi:two-component system, response regulator PdtaR